jgi:hypothetical protein
LRLTLVCMKGGILVRAAVTKAIHAAPDET